MDTNTKLLNKYISLAGFLTDSIGMRSGIVVYSVDAASCIGELVGFSGEVGERTIGSVMSPFIQHVLSSIISNGYQPIHHVDTEPSSHGGCMKLSFYPIMNEGNLIGLFVLSFEIDSLYSILNQVHAFLDIPLSGESSAKIMKNTPANPSLIEYMQQVIKDTISEYGVPVHLMTNEDKRSIVQKLEKRDVFFVRDSSRITAESLGISVPTLYRMIKKNEKQN